MYSPVHHEVNIRDAFQWYTIETTWSKDRTKTTKKQRFKYIQEALLRVRDTKERMKMSFQLPMLPLSILRGTSEMIRAQRTSEFNAFLAAAISVPQLRVLPSLVQLLAPDDIGSQSSLYALAVPTSSPAWAVCSSQRSLHSLILAAQLCMAPRPDPDPTSNTHWCSTAGTSAGQLQRLRGTPPPWCR